MHFLDMPLHICFDTEPPITTLHSAIKLVLVSKHVPIQVVFPFITEVAVFKWTVEESLQKQKTTSKTKLFP
jgi:nickel-dependent lactate racemase